MIKMAIVHFMPLEYFPPVTNLIKFLCERKSIEVAVYSCHNVKSRDEFQGGDVKITRYPFVVPSMARIIKLLYYGWFNLGTLLKLIVQNPDVILYYESYSAMPVYWYKKYLNRSVRLFIHQHEYFDKQWYDKGMATVKKYHEKEVQFLYPSAEWISQTNAFRKELFGQDNPHLNMNNLHILANYPPKDWLNKKNTQAEDDNQKKLVYVGSLSLQATYIRECCTWVEQQGGKVSLDIFSYNLDSETKAYLNALNSQWITFNDKGIEYYNLPNFLGDYDIGLIIYKPYSDNVKYCASNKLFEYMVCGLDVWFSNIMEGTHSYICETSHPRVIDVNFEQLSHYSEEKLFGNGMLSYNPPQYSCEDEYEKLYKVIISEV